MKGVNEDQEWIEQCRWQLKLSVKERIASAFQGRFYINRENRTFDTMAEYRKWCIENYPAFLGYDWSSYDSAKS